MLVEMIAERKKFFATQRAAEQISKPPTKTQIRNRMCAYLKNMEVVKSSETRTEGSSKRAGDELESDKSKKQKIDEHVEAEKDDDQEQAEMKRHIEIVKNDEVAIDAIPLATKPPMIVEYKIDKDGRMGYFKLIRGDGSSKRYSSIIKMLQDINREDLETLWKLVKAKHGNTRPEEDYERVLWGDLKVMFEPDIKSEIWRNLQDYALWEVIVNGDSPPPKRTIDGVEQTYPPTTAEEKLAMKNELKIWSSEGLGQTYDKLQKLISQLEILGETVSQENMNLKFLRSLPSEWKTHTLFWINKPELDTLSMDDLYNNLKIYETKVKGSSSSNQNSQNVAFVSSNNSGSSNQAYGSNSANTDSMSDIDVDNLEEMDLKWQMAMLTMRARIFLNKTGRKINANGSKTIWFNKSKVECYNCHKRVILQGSVGAEEGPTNFALMAYTSLGSSSSSSSDSEVSTCSKACSYKACLESIEARLDVYKKNEVVFEEDIKILKLDIKLRDNALTELRKKFKKAEKERDDLKLTLEKFGNSSKNLSKLLKIQVSDKFKTGVGFDSQVVNSQVFDSQENDRYKISEGYHAPYTGNFMPPKYDLVFPDEGEYVFSESVTSIPDVAKSKAKTNVSKPKSVGEPLIEDWISDSEDENETEFKFKQRKPSFVKTEFVKSNEHVKTTRESVKKVENKKQAKYPRKNSQSPRDCDLYEKKMVEKTVWNNARRANHQNSQRITHPHPKGNFVPKAVLVKSSIKTLNTVGQNFSKAAVSVNTARPINTAYPRPTVNSARTASNVFNRAHTYVSRPFNKSTTNKNSN
ncbi:hypothetical protein Tco_0518106 [Tanacetum coccineum]